MVIQNKKPISNIYIDLLHKKNKFCFLCNKIPWLDKNGDIKGVMGISREVTQIKKITDDALRMETIFKTLMDNIPDSIYFKDKKSRFILINKATSDRFGLGKPEDAIGLSDFDFFEGHAKKAYEDEQNIMKTGKPIINLEEKETSTGREDKWITTTKMPYYDKKGKIIGTFGISRDITERKKAEEKVKYLSFHDVLTGLFNRAFFEVEFKRLNTKRQLPITIVIGDVNRLKIINDIYGHENGDLLLKKISSILKNSFRKEDIISRWGGDEFVVILPQTKKEDIQGILQRIKEKCAKGSTHRMPLSISLGVATKRKLKEKLENVFKEAEDSMYKRKIEERESTHEVLINSFKKNLEITKKRDKELIEKLQDYALQVGKKLKLSRVKLDELKLLINLHSIGKLSILDEIMAKSSRLTDEEWKILKGLPKIGYRIAESSEQLKPISEAILAHQERYDGKGYPRGIKGEEIPVLSRISLLINSFEAMLGDRPYRKKLSIKQAINEIKKCSGTQFDPQIVNVFLGIIEEDQSKRNGNKIKKTK